MSLLPLAAVANAKDRHMIHYFHRAKSALASDLDEVCKVSVSTYSDGDTEAPPVIREISDSTFKGILRGVEAIPDFRTHLVQNSETKLDLTNTHVVGIATIKDGKKETRVFAIPTKTSPDFQKWLRTMLGERITQSANSKKETFTPPERTLREMQEWLKSPLDGISTTE